MCKDFETLFRLYFDLEVKRLSRSVNRVMMEIMMEGVF